MLKAYEMFKCEHCGALKEPLRSSTTVCGDCRDDSMHSVLICGSCDENEVKDENDSCAECQAAATEAKEGR